MTAREMLREIVQNGGKCKYIHIRTYDDCECRAENEGEMCRGFEPYYTSENVEISCGWTTYYGKCDVTTCPMLKEVDG